MFLELLKIWLTYKWDLSKKLKQLKADEKFRRKQCKEYYYADLCNLIEKRIKAKESKHIDNYYDADEEIEPPVGTEESRRRIDILKQYKYI